MISRLKSKCTTGRVWPLQVNGICRKLDMSQKIKCNNWYQLLDYLSSSCSLILSFSIFFVCRGLFFSYSVSVVCFSFLSVVFRCWYFIFCWRSRIPGECQQILISIQLSCSQAVCVCVYYQCVLFIIDLHSFFDLLPLSFRVLLCFFFKLSALSYIELQSNCNHFSYGLGVLSR